MSNPANKRFVPIWIALGAILLIQLLTLAAVAVGTVAAGAAAATAAAALAGDEFDFDGLPSLWDRLIRGGSREDGVRIAGEYVIRPTRRISDAYLSGDSTRLDDKEKETLRMASAVLSQIVRDDMSDYEKELAVYDWMTANLAFDSGSLIAVPQTQEDCDNPYGVLKYHNAVCVGYATTFRLFMQMMKIDCMVVHNLDLGHSWDLVCLGGEWYHTDIYSDVGTGNHSHFNLSDMQMGQMQSWDRELFPAAEGIAFNYAVQNSVELKSAAALPSALRKVIDEGGGSLFYRLDDPTGALHSSVDYAVSRLQGLLEQDYETGHVWMYAEMLPLSAEFDVLSITVEVSGGDAPVEPEEDDFPAIDQAIDDAFGDWQPVEYEGEWQQGGHGK